MPWLLRTLSRIRRRILIHRRGLAALCVGAAVWSTLGVLHPAPGETVELWTASRDLASGTVLAPDDLRRTRVPVGTAPDDAVRRPAGVLGRTLLVPLGRDQVLTVPQVLGHEHLSGYPGRSALGLRIPDVGVADLLRAGDRVDLVASDPQHAHPPELLVHDAIVLTVPAHDDAGTGSAGLVGAGTGRLVVFAVPSTDVENVAATGTALYLSVIWNR
jgi:pilus assembly protein CpaB